jgi:hypothetical protein
VFLLDFATAHHSDPTGAAFNDVEAAADSAKGAIIFVSDVRFRGLFPHV